MNEIKQIVGEQLKDLQMLMHRSMHKQYGELHNPHRGQGRILAILKLKPEISQKELTYLLDMSKQAVAELVTKLEKAGYITREQSTDDKRVMIIKLTEQGAQAGEESIENELSIENKLDCLNDEELPLFSEYLGRIIKEYEKQFPNEDFAERRKKMEDFMSSYGRGFEHHRHNEPGRRGRRINPGSRRDVANRTRNHKDDSKKSND